MRIVERLTTVPGLAETGPMGFAQVVVAGDLVFVAGQTAIDAQWQVVAADFEGQARQVMKNLRTALEAAGSALQGIVSMTVFLAHPSYVPVFSKIRAEEMEGIPCASSAICGVNFVLPGLLLEVEVTAIKTSASGQEQTT